MSVVENMEVFLSSPSQSPESSSLPSCGLALPLPSPSGLDLPSSISHSQSPMENRVISKIFSKKDVGTFYQKYVGNPIRDEVEAQFAYSNQLSEGFNPSKRVPIRWPVPRKMAKVREVLSFLDIKVYSRRKSRCSTGNKKVECDRRFVGSVWTVRNKEWVALLTCRASGGILIIWDSKNLRSEEVVIGSFSVSVKFALDGCGPFWLSTIYGQTTPHLGRIFGLTSSVKDFGGFIRECELLDPPLRNASFTWSNMQESPVCKRLDSFLYSNEWGHFFPQSLQEALPRRTSDHWSIILDTNPFKWGLTPFRKFIKALENESGLELNNPESITEEILLYFEKLYVSPIGESWSVEGLDWSPISEESASRLDSFFTEEEISKAIFQLDRDKVPGPDGFTIAVFQDCWDVIKEDLVRVFAEFHRSGIINQSTNASFIVLLPKKSLTKKISDFRPISLITSLYKIITKVLSRSIRGVLHETIHSSQGSYVQGRQILDAVLIANEIVDEKRRSGEEGVVFKIDFEKAYDHVSWDFWDHVLEKKGFSPRWRKWMSGCLSMVSYAVLVNGNAKGWVKASRGLRQGNPLSPFMFTLVVDVLSRMLLRAEERNSLEGFRIGSRSTLTRVIFMASILIRIIFLGWQSCLIARLLVGLYSIWVFLWEGILRLVAFGIPVIERISRRFDGWQKAYLSFGGRVTLVQSCLTHMPRVGEGKRDHLVSWDVVCNPTAKGGLGFGKISLRNLALLGKWLWRYPREGVFQVYSVCGRRWGKNSVLGRFVMGGPTFGIPISKTIWRNSRIFEEKARNSEYLWDSIHFLASLWAFCFKVFKGIPLMDWVPPRSILDMMYIKFNGFGSSKRGIALWQAANIALIQIVWRERNARIFEDKARNSEFLWDSIVFFAFLWAYYSKLDRDKAPGPDDFTIAVFQDCWDVIKEDLVRVFAEFHSAFVQERQILDAVLIGNEIVDEKRRSGEEGVVFKIDFEKAYDHVSWDFLDHVLEKKGYSPRWRKWMRGCLSTVSFAVLVNGNAKEWVKASRGLRQGNPLSHFLFTLVADVLSRMLLGVEERNSLEGFRTLKSLLLVFGHISRLKVNLDKSNIYGINLDQNHLSRLAKLLDCKASVIERISRRLDGWQKAYLSFGGRITLIQSCLTHMPCYFLSLFKIPASVAAKIERLQRDFLWSGVREGKRDHLVSWDVVCKSKAKGGLGFGKIVLRNVALLGKWLWRYPREGSALWHQEMGKEFGSGKTCGGGINLWDPNIQDYLE
ncbi:Transposon TX1 uncharacterized 149 kDa protein [Vitis vinifera]|uniref:Transposon TX1 uncharacterized 149 kDa protein n=1 Tax=Vitis vinifera TaxID=29760 RepID=A0A438FWK8_VITVI|nr:Transposon TX1 uncharacterized 149 kDa protein [Vitis vinifera]